MGPLQSTLASDYHTIAFKMPANGSPAALGDLLGDLIANKGAQTVLGVKIVAPSADFEWAKPGEDTIPAAASVDWCEPIAERILEAEVQSAATAFDVVAVVYLR